MKKIPLISHNIDSFFLLIVAIILVFRQITQTSSNLRADTIGLFIYLFSPFLLFVFSIYFFSKAHKKPYKVAFSVGSIIYSLYILAHFIVGIVFVTGESEYCHTTFYECFFENLPMLIITVIMGFFSVKNIILALTWKREI